MQHRLLLLVSSAVVIVLALGGCGGSSDEVALEDDDGNLGRLNSHKPLPDFAQLIPQIQTQGLGQILPWSGIPRNASVPPNQCSWWRTHYPTGAKRVVFTLQQVPDEDTDLYVLDGTPWDANSLLALSDRVPDDLQPDRTSRGVPDWVSVVLEPTAGVPQILVFGHEFPDADFSIEVDTVVPLPTDGTPLSKNAPMGDSRWYRFKAQAGKQHSIALAATWPSDPDMVLYDTNSAGFVGRNSLAGGGSIVFTPNNARWHYLRVYGWGSLNNNPYSVSLTVSS